MQMLQRSLAASRLVRARKALMPSKIELRPVQASRTSSCRSVWGIDKMVLPMPQYRLMVSLFLCK